jgi:multicomponent Na+:H+ antiporter subunit C
MTLLLLLSISIVVASAVYLTLSRDLFRVVIGLTLLSAATNLVVFAAGRFASMTPPLLSSVDDASIATASNPLVQALVLTAIVISFALLCFSLVLGARLRTLAESDDVRALQSAEPPAGDADKPAELES